MKASWMSVGLVVVLVGSALAQEAQRSTVSRLRLKPHVESTGRVSLADVLDLSAADPMLRPVLADAPLFETVPEAGTVDVSHRHVQQRLAALRINAARVLVGGALQCRITRLTPKPPQQQSPAASAHDVAPLFRVDDEQPFGERTLGREILDALQRELAPLGGRVEMLVEPASEPYVELTSPPYDFRLRGLGSREIGPRELRVSISRDGERQRTIPLFVKVQLTRPVVVAARPLNIGGVVRPDDVRLEQRVFDAGDALGLVELGAAVGQKVRRFIPAGEMVAERDLKPEALVKRSQPVTVVGNAGGISAQVSGYCLDNGSFGDEVRVRIGTDRRDRREVRGRVVGLGEVRLLTQ